MERSFVRFNVADDGVIRFHDLDDSLTVAELFHGPTMAFKDLALSVVGQMYSYFLEKRKRHMTIVVGTSGDTGSAAIEAVRGKPWLDIVVLLPKVGLQSFFYFLQSRPTTSKPCSDGMTWSPSGVYFAAGKASRVISRAAQIQIYQIKMSNNAE